MKNSDKWKNRFISLAKEISTWSKDPSTQIGCVAIEPETGRILSVGYNGFPEGIEDSEKRLNDRQEKYKYVIHAEKNCIYNACKNGISLEGCHFYVYGYPTCSECTKSIVQVGASSVFYKMKEKGVVNPKWMDENKISESIYAEVGLSYEEIK